VCHNVIHRNSGLLSFYIVVISSYFRPSPGHLMYKSSSFHCQILLYYLISLLHLHYYPSSLHLFISHWVQTFWVRFRTMLATDKVSVYGPWKTGWIDWWLKWYIVMAVLILRKSSSFLNGFKLDDFHLSCIHPDSVILMPHRKHLRLFTSTIWTQPSYLIYAIKVV
jgi:hypothetical protein